MTVRYAFVPDPTTNNTLDWVVRQFRKLQYAIGRGDRPANFIVPDAITSGTLVGTTSDDVTDVQTMLDGNVYDIVEANVATPGLTVDFEFSGLEEFRGIALRAYYNGVSTHHIEMQLWDYNGSAFVDVHTLMYRDAGASSAYEYVYLELPDTTNYLENGDAIIRFTHPDTGQNTHHFFIDYLAITG